MKGLIGETYLIGADGERSNIDVLRAILRSMDRPEDDFDWVRDRPDHDRRYAIDSAKLRRELWWEPVHTDFMSGLEKTIEWCRDNEDWWHPAKEATEAKIDRGEEETWLQETALHPAISRLLKLRLKA